MPTIEVKNFTNDADEVATPPNARVETVNVLGNRVMRLTVQPGWKWSSDIKPVVGTDSCQAKHVGVIVEGTITCRHDDGTQVTYSAGDAYAIDPGHDAWVEGDKPAVAFEFHGMWGE
ncbi:MAG: cupin domain-containing protein [Alphaproteobacteria bacterium]